MLEVRSKESDLFEHALRTIAGADSSASRARGHSRFSLRAFALLSAGKTFGQAGVNDPPLRRGVLIISVMKLRAVYYQLWSEDDFSAVEGGFNEVTFHNAGLGA